MPIPGANLGQGMPGGQARLPGSLPLPGGGTLGPPPGNLGVVAPRRPVVAAPRPTSVHVDPRAAREVGSGLSSIRAGQYSKENPGSTKNITVALGILDQVRNKKLRPDKAAKLMQGLTYGDQGKLAELVSQRNAREGRIDTNEIKALQALQELPAPNDVEPHDILSNFTRDTQNLIVGLPAGLALTGVYGAKDLLNLAPGRKHTSNLYKKIIKPTAQTYADTYGPLFHGHVGKTLHQFKEHPLQPILDAATVASLGVGGAARVGAASGAIAGAKAQAAGLVRAVGKTERRMAEPPHDIIRGMNTHDELGVPISAWHPKTIENQNFDLGDDHVFVSAAVDKETGKIYSSTRDHTEIMDDLGAKFPVEKAYDPKAFRQYSVMIDRNTGKVASVNGRDDGFRDVGDELLGKHSEADAVAQQVQAKLDAAAKVGHTPDLSAPGDVVMYRGDKTPINEFHIDKTNSTEQLIGQGHYFTPQEGLAKSFGDHVTKITLPAEVASKVLDFDSVPTAEVRQAIEASLVPMEKNLPATIEKELGLDQSWMKPGEFENFVKGAIEDEMAYIDQVREALKNPNLTFREILHGHGKEEISTWDMPEGWGNPDLQSALRANLSQLGHVGFKQKLHGGARGIDPAEEWSLWDSKTVNEAVAREKGGPNVAARANVEVPDHFWERPTPEELAKEPYRSHFGGFYNEKTGEVQTAPPGMRHDDLLENLKDPELAKVLDDPKQGWRPFSGIIDPETGHVARINMHEANASGEIREIPAPPGLVQKVDAAFDDPIKKLDPKTPYNEHVGFTSGGNKVIKALPEAWDEEVTQSITDPNYMRDHAWTLRMPVAVNKATGDIHVGGPGFAHDDLQEFRYFDENNKYKAPEDMPDPQDPQWLEGTAIRDPDTGQVVRVNFGEFTRHPEEGATGPLVSGLGNHDRVGYEGVDLEHLQREAIEGANIVLDTAKSDPKHPFMENPPQQGAEHEAMQASLDALPQKPIEPNFNLAAPPGRMTLAKVGAKAFLKKGGQGGLIDFYDRRKGITHEAEIQNTMKEVADVLDNPNLRLSRRKMGEVVRDVAADIRATRAAGKVRPGEMASGLPEFIAGGSTGRALSAAETTMREASDLVRAGAIYLRPAYLPNNWAGNVFMNLTQQGVLAPVNLAKSLVLDQHIGARYTRAMDKSMGATPAEVVTGGSRRGYVAALTQPAAHVMGAMADQPFRRAAWLHEARRAGYSKLSEVKGLFDKAAGGDEGALREISDIARKAQEEIVKFGHMNENERSVIRNLVFVYSWMRGAGRYAMRFGAQHPIQTNIFNQASKEGKRYVDSIMGGVPSFMAGVVPVGRDKDGNPRVINPFALNPLGTGLQMVRAAMGTAQVLKDPKGFSKFAQTDIVDLLNPILGSYINARSGGQPVKKQLENTIAALSLVKGIRHPGSGSIYPTSRAEAIGHFTGGALFPRVANAQAVKKALEREHAGNPQALIPQQMKDFKKATGEDLDLSLVAAYRADLEAVQIEKDFQSKYAESHGASGFRNMPPSNRLEAGLDFLRKYSVMDPKDIAELEAGTKDLTTDEQYNDFANAVWNMTGIGQYKDAWDSLMHDIRNRGLTRKRG